MTRKWVAGRSMVPVRRDGLLTPLSYLIVAVKEEADKYNCVCVRNKGGEFNVKFYPSFEFWGVTEQDLVDLGFYSFMTRSSEGYERGYTTNRGLVSLVRRLSTSTTSCVVPYEKLDEAWSIPRSDDTDRKVHPYRGPTIPDQPIVVG